MAREYRLLDQSDTEARLDKYRQRVDLTSLGDFEYSWEDRWTEFEHSPEFRQLSPREQALSRYTIKRVVGDEAPWLVQESNNTDNLLGLPSPRHALPSTIDDAMILSGTRGWEIYQELIEEDHENRYNLGRLALNDYVDLTVAAMLYGRSDIGADLSYFVEGEDGTTVRQTVGGTFHGDFAAGWKRFASSGVVRDPAGVLRDFAPAISGEYVRAYHSVEDDIAVAMLTYLAAGNSDRLNATKRIMLNALAAADLGRGGGNFADFGVGNNNQAGMIFVDDFREYMPGELMRSYIVTPGNYDFRMEIVAAKDGVVLRNTNNKKSEGGDLQTEILGSMTIKRDEIPHFVATMAAASAGRTSIEQIYKAIAEARVRE